DDRRVAAAVRRRELEVAADDRRITGAGVPEDRRVEAAADHRRVRVAAVYAWSPGSAHCAVRRPQVARLVDVLDRRFLVVPVADHRAAAAAADDAAEETGEAEGRIGVRVAAPEAAIRLDHAELIREPAVLVGGVAAEAKRLCFAG